MLKPREWGRLHNACYKACFNTLAGCWQSSSSIHCLGRCTNTAAALQCGSART